MKYDRGSGSWLCLSRYTGRGGGERNGAQRPSDPLDSMQRVLHKSLENSCELVVHNHHAFLATRKGGAKV